ncbi:MAG TPA: cell wall-binding repeat-containing protein [Solirubrobacterales bacterium]|nr:cell wall-binding repeat-containing protein [Solirubrobacterales bacterium]
MSRRIKLPRLPGRGKTTGDRGESPQESDSASGDPPKTEQATSADSTPKPDATGAGSGDTTPITLGPPDLDADEPGGEGPLSQLQRPALIASVLLLVAAAGVGIGYLIFDEGGDSAPPPAVAPTAVIEAAPEPEAAEEIGFPAFATQNTTRVGGPDSVAVAAGVALASSPSVGGVGGPEVVTIAPEDSWQAALAAGSLAARPTGAPILLGRPGEIPGFTAEALRGLAPTGSERGDGVQVVAIGGVASPDDLQAVELTGDDPAELAKLIDRQRGRLSGVENPPSILVTSAEQAPFAMPAAAWAARSGDPIVFADGDEVPQATIDVIERHPDARVYVLGPESVIGKKAVRQLGRTAGRAIRIAGPDPITNAITFARFVDGAFGWNINDPGHGFTIANTDRPADAGAGAPLAAGGKPGPLLLTDSATEMPRELRNYLLDTKPGFTDDPTRAIYNHVWLLGDTSAISLDFQAQVDELTRLEQVSRGAGVPEFDAGQDEPEAEVDPSRLKPDAP